MVFCHTCGKEAAGKWCTECGEEVFTKDELEEFRKWKKEKNINAKTDFAPPKVEEKKLVTKLEEKKVLEKPATQKVESMINIL